MNASPKPLTSHSRLSCWWCQRKIRACQWSSKIYFTGELLQGEGDLSIELDIILKMYSQGCGEICGWKIINKKIINIWIKVEFLANLTWQTSCLRQAKVTRSNLGSMGVRDLVRYCCVISFQAWSNIEKWGVLKRTGRREKFREPLFYIILPVLCVCSIIMISITKIWTIK